MKIPGREPKTPYQKEWEALLKKEKRLLEKRKQKKGEGSDRSAGEEDRGKTTGKNGRCF